MQGELLYNMDLKEKKKDISIIILLTMEQTARQCDICCLPAHIYTISIFLSKNISTLNPVIKVVLFRWTDSLRAKCSLLAWKTKDARRVPPFIPPDSTDKNTHAFLWMPTVHKTAQERDGKMGSQLCRENKKESRRRKDKATPGFVRGTCELLCPCSGLHLNAAEAEYEGWLQRLTALLSRYPDPCTQGPVLRHPSPLQTSTALQSRCITKSTREGKLVDSLLAARALKEVRIFSSSLKRYREH